MRILKVNSMIIFFFMIVGITQAATIYVPKDYPTIQKGIDAASNGDTVIIADGVYKGEGNVNLDFKGKAITVKSENGPANCIIDCENRDETSGFKFQKKETTSSIVDGFTIENSTASGISCRDSSPTIINNIIINNSSNQDGGGIDASSNSSPKISNNIIKGNSANRDGGGINCYWYSISIITNNTIIENSANARGGGISCGDGSTPMISLNTISKNKAERGAGISCGGGTIFKNDISENSANTGGGGIYCQGGPPKIDDNIIGSNSANSYGGGIYCWNSSPTIVNNVIDSNRVNDYGGGICCWDNSSATINNNIITKNKANNGGGIVSWGSSPKITNNTVVGNSSVTKSGGIYCGSSPVIANTIFWNNTPQDITHLESGIITISYSDIQGGKASVVGNVNWLDGNINADPLFADPSNNDYHLNAKSPCIDAGTTGVDIPDKDMEGNPRPRGAKPDIGAYEYLPEPQNGASIAIVTEPSVIKGNTAKVSITIKDVVNLAGFQMDIAFDPKVIEASSVEEGNFLSNTGSTYFLEPKIDNIKGEIIGVACVKTGKGGSSRNGTLVTITFKAKGVGESRIRLQNVNLSDIDGDLIPVKLSDGIITVKQYPPWDVNNDGLVNVIDLVIVGQHFGEKPPFTGFNPDVNNDRIVDILDLVLVGTHFGEQYSPAAPSSNIWAFEPQYMPMLVKMYKIMEANPGSDPGFIITKNILGKLISYSMPAETRVFQNYPNPFNPDTWIPYQLKDAGDVMIQIFDASGKLVRKLDLGYRSAGSYIDHHTAAHWDGKNEAGDQVSSGVYFYCTQSESYNTTMKMVITK